MRPSSAAMKVKVIPVLEDNYMYLVIEERTREAVAVDVAVPKRVRAGLRQREHRCGPRHLGPQGEALDNTAGGRPSPCFLVSGYLEFRVSWFGSPLRLEPSLNFFTWCLLCTQWVLTNRLRGLPCP